MIGKHHFTTTLSVVRVGTDVNPVMLSETLQVVGLTETVSRTFSVVKKNHELVCIR